MRQTELELYRWEWHNLYHLNDSKIKAHYGKHISRVAYWKEFGAFTSILPRQVGKTKMLGTMANKTAEAKERILVVLGCGTEDQFCNKTGIDTSDVRTCYNILGHIVAMRCFEVNLFIDEFMYIPEYTLRDLLDRDWKSVTMVGSVK